MNLFYNPVEIRLRKKCSALYLQRTYRADNFFGSLISTRLLFLLVIVGSLHTHTHPTLPSSPEASTAFAGPLLQLVPSHYERLPRLFHTFLPRVPFKLFWSSPTNLNTCCHMTYKEYFQQLNTLTYTELQILVSSFFPFLF